MGETVVATNCKVTVAFTTVQCDSSPGTGKNLKFKIRFGGQDSGSFDSDIRYAKPTITGFTVPTQPGGSGGGENTNGEDAGNDNNDGNNNGKC